jgi:hypothetical protein
LEVSKSDRGNWFGRHKVLSVIGGIIVLIIIISVATSGGNKGNDGTVADKQSTPSTQKSTTKTKPAAKFAFDDGTFKVGSDIKPGTYRTHGGDGSAFGCYWARLSGFSGEVDDIIANNGSYTNGSQVVTIAPSDKGFQTQGCGKWYAQLTQVTSSKTTFGDGMLIVGTDVAPGTYKNSGAKDDYSCYWARLSGFSGTIDDIIANGVNKSNIVTIAPSDKGFSSAGCGTWTKQ